MATLSGGLTYSGLKPAAPTTTTTSLQQPTTTTTTSKTSSGDGVVRSTGTEYGPAYQSPTLQQPVPTATPTLQQPVPTATPTLQQTQQPQVSSALQAAAADGMQQTGTQYGMIPQLQSPTLQQTQQTPQQTFNQTLGAPPGAMTQMSAQFNPVDPTTWGEMPLDIYGNTLGGMQQTLATGGIPGLITNGIQDVAGLWQQMENAWGQSPEVSPYTAQLLQNMQYTPGSLTGAVAQNWQNAMDPAAWEQRANNLMATQRENLLAGLNTAERRERGAAARGGFNPGAALGNAYGQYSQGLTQAGRDIYNDSMAQQMQAMQGASQYALGSEAQDRALYNQALSMMGQSNMFDAAQRSADHTNFGEFAGGVMGTLSGVLGGAAQGAGGLLGGLGSIAGPLAAGAILGAPLGI